MGAVHGQSDCIDDEKGGREPEQIRSRQAVLTAASDKGKHLNRRR